MAGGESALKQYDRALILAIPKSLL